MKLPILFRRRCRFSIFTRTHSNFHRPIRFLSPSPSPSPTLPVLKSPNFATNPIAPPAAAAAFAFASFTSSSSSSIHTPGVGVDYSTDEGHDFDQNAADRATGGTFTTFMDILRTGSVQEKRKKLQECGAPVTPELVADVLSATRNDWETAFTFFLWAGNQPGFEHSLREYHTMISILGKFRKFDTAWTLIDEMKAASIATPHTLLIMIRKYAAVHDVPKAISTFYAHRRFKFKMGMDQFQGLLSALSRYKNVKDAEHLMFCNQSLFPLNTKSFNIVLNGWCNVVGDLREGKRIWKQMELRGIKHDVYSFGSIMSCYSKMNNLKSVLWHYERMKALGMKPDSKVYNAVIHSLAKARLVKEARNVMKTMEEEGCSPDAICYNSLIMPLCKARLLDDANRIFDEMMERGLQPTIRTYHGFFQVLRTSEEVFALLKRMYKTGCNPGHDTYIMLIKKFCRWRQLDNVFKLWDEMRENGLDPDRSSYIVLIHGLFLNGKLEEAHKYYLEMKDKDLMPEPSVDAMLQAWLEGKRDGNNAEISSKDDASIHWDIEGKTEDNLRKNHRVNHYLRRPELRSVTRERGFSFWEN